MSMSAGVAVEKKSEYILAHTGPRELDGRRQGPWIGVTPVDQGSFRGNCDKKSLIYTTLSVRVRTKI